MLLTECEIQRILEQAKTAFPHFIDWEYNNEINEDYFGFSLWGRFVLDPEDQMPRCFFITLDTYKESWHGHVTIGQPCTCGQVLMSVTPIYLIQSLARP